MKSQVKKWGNSAAVRIPAPVLHEAGFKLDQTVDIREEDGRVVIAAEPAARYDIGELVKRIDADNRHEFIDIGAPRGHEVK
jgi:antitoxin MazE